MRVAIIGAGFFGSTIALKLSQNHEVDLFEKESDIMNCASKINQFRFHKGFHYPRSKKTIQEIQSSYKLFTNFYSEKVFEPTINYYGVANKNSKVSYKKYLDTLKKNNLNFKITKTKYPNTSNMILTDEKVLNYFKFKKFLKKKLLKENIKIFTKNNFKKKQVKNYDKIILCTYASNNKLLKNLYGKYLPSYKYELIEKILIELPKKYRNKSFVIIDGQFVCVDPYLGTNYHLLSDVKHSKIEIIKNTIPKFKSSKKKFLNGKLVKDIKISNFKNFIKHGSIYLPFLKDAKYKGSMFVIRTLKKNVEKSDERTGEVQTIGNKFLSIFSGKWNTCVYIANKVEKILNK